MELAGIEIARPALLELVGLLTHARADDTAALLLIADAKGNERVSITDRETILNVLVDAPDGLERLHAVLLQEHVARARGDTA